MKATGSSIAMARATLQEGARGTGGAWWHSSSEREEGAEGADGGTTIRDGDGEVPTGAVGAAGRADCLFEDVNGRRFDEYSVYAAMDAN